MLKRDIEIDEAPAWLTRGRIPCLDGLRAISIALVLIGHELMAHNIIPEDKQPHWFQPYVMGMTGVDVFFVISGFLITLLMLRERQRTGNISLIDFFRRRALRILPAYCGFLVAVFIATHIGWEKLAKGDWIAALTYTMDFRTEPAWTVGHLWSLSVEEQFYLLWPPTLILLSPKWAKRALGLGIILPPLFRIAMREVAPQFRALGTMSFPAKLEPIAAGCLLALLAWEASGRARLKLFNGPKPAIIGLILLAIKVVAASRIKIFALAFSSTFDAVVISIVVWSCATSERNLLGKLLSWRPMAMLGVLSYSVYLWQQPFMNPTSEGAWRRFPLNLGLTFAAAGLSYVLIESPFLRLKDRPRNKADKAPTEAPNEVSATLAAE